MLRKDYIVRQFEEFGKVMALIFGLKKQNDFLNFEKELNAATLKFTALDINYIEDLSVTDFETQIINTTTLTSLQQHMLADLLFEKLNYDLQINSANVINLKQKCTQLYTLINNTKTQNEFNLDVHYKLSFLATIS